MESTYNYDYMIREDAKAMNKKLPASLIQRIKFILLPDYTLLYLMRLRKLESLLSQTGRGRLHTIRLKIAKYRLLNLGLKLNYEISPFCFGPGLSLYHNGIIVNPDVKAGRNCTLRAYTVIGNKKSGDYDSIPCLGNNVDIGCNCSIIGQITIGDNVTIGAGSVVVCDLPADTICVGNPAKPVRFKK